MSEPTVFDVCEIKRGQTRGADDDNPLGAVFRLFCKVHTDDSGETDTEQVVGKFKGLVSVATDEHKQLYADSKAKLIGKLFERMKTIYELHAIEQDLFCKEFPFEKEYFIVNEQDEV